MLLCKLHSEIPLVEQDTAIYGFLRIAKLGVCIDCLLTETHGLELLTKLLKDGRLFWQGVNDIGQVSEVLHLVISKGKILVFVGQLVVLGCLGPFLPLSGVVSKILVHSSQHLIVTSS